MTRMQRSSALIALLLAPVAASASAIHVPAGASRQDYAVVCGQAA